METFFPLLYTMSFMDKTLTVNKNKQKKIANERSLYLSLSFICRYDCLSPRWPTCLYNPWRIKEKIIYKILNKNKNNTLEITNINCNFDVRNIHYFLYFFIFWYIVTCEFCLFVLWLLFFYRIPCLQLPTSPT
jgi:hypothetical protein